MIMPVSLKDPSPEEFLQLLQEWVDPKYRRGKRFNPLEIFKRGYHRGREDKWKELDELIASYPKDGKWDDALAVWAYGKGFEAGLHHSKEKKDD